MPLFFIDYKIIAPYNKPIQKNHNETGKVFMYYKILECGCAVYEDNFSACPHDQNRKILIPQPDLTFRFAICYWCTKQEPSDIKMPFFNYRPNEKTDMFDCGCRGWD